MRFLNSSSTCSSRSIVVGCLVNVLAELVEELTLVVVAELELELGAGRLELELELELGAGRLELELELDGAKPELELL